MAGTLRIRKQSITEMDVDCIVNAANSQLRHGGGVCGAIFAAAGARELQAACDALGHCPTGEAVITPGFKLKAKYIVHAVGPIWQGGNHNEENLLYRCYQNAMKVACAKGCRSIAFPLFSGSGVRSDNLLIIDLHFQCSSIIQESMSRAPSAAETLRHARRSACAIRCFDGISL